MGDSRAQRVILALIESDIDRGIRVELYGIARHRVGASRVWIPADHALTLEALWQYLFDQHPDLGAFDLNDSRPSSIYRINIDGQQFVSDPQTQIQVGQCVLVMSADAGG